MPVGGYKGRVPTSREGRGLQCSSVWKKRRRQEGRMEGRVRERMDDGQVDGRGLREEAAAETRLQRGLA